MASDSRVTLNTQTQVQGQPTIMNVAVGMSDNNFKTFLAHGRIGISIHGQADQNGIPISGNIETFIREQEAQNLTTVQAFANDLKDFFRQYNPIPQTHFFVAGYDINGNDVNQRLYGIDVSGNTVTAADTTSQGCQWGGESDVLVRLLQPTFFEQQQGNTTTYQPLPHYGLPFQWFTIQDAIDFAVYAIRTTIDTIKFQPRAKTVGGPIDVLVIKPTGAKWISLKELKVQ